MMTPTQVAEKVVQALDSKKAVDIQVLHTGKITSIADYVVICTANSMTQLKALSEEVDRVLSEADEPPLRREGYRTSGWTLLDFGCVVVHLFLDEMRKFYNLEHLWGEAEKIDISSLLGPQ